MPVEQDAIEALEAWYCSLDRYQDRLPSKGSIAAALHVLDRLRADFNLSIASHVAGGEAQITGLSATTLKKLLSAFGESRLLSSVGGRSNRGARGDVAALLSAMEPLRLGAFDADSRNAVLTAMQKHIVDEYVKPYFSAKRVKATFDPGVTTVRFIETILENARLSSKAGAVAEYLVGAKLSLRFPDLKIRNKRFTTADMQGGFHGDLEIGTTVFHITITPMPELFAKLTCDLEAGRRVYLLVPKSQVVGAQQNSNLIDDGRIAVESIESFVATNVDELSGFDGGKLRSGCRRLLEKYNERVDEIEVDKSLLIEIPPNLG